MNFNHDHKDYLFPVTDKKDIDRCLNCTKPECTGDCFFSGQAVRPHARVRCLETGVIYANQRMAAASVKRSSNVMSKHLNGRAKSCGGLHFERIKEV